MFQYFKRLYWGMMGDYHYWRAYIHIEKGSGKSEYHFEKLSKYDDLYYDKY